MPLRFVPGHGHHLARKGARTPCAVAHRALKAFRFINRLNRKVSKFLCFVVLSGEKPASTFAETTLSAARGDPDDMPRAAAALRARLDLLDGETRLAQPPRESAVRPARPHGKHAAGPQRRVGRRQAARRRRARRWPVASGRPGRCRHRAGSRRKRRGPRGSARPTSASTILTRGSSRLAPKTRPSARAPRRRQPEPVRRRRSAPRAPSAPSAARSVKPMPSPPIRIRACARAVIRSQRKRRQRLLGAAQAAVHQLGVAEHDRKFARRAASAAVRRRREFAPCRAGARESSGIFQLRRTTSFARRKMLISP